MVILTSIIGQNFCYPQMLSLLLSVKTTHFAQKFLFVLNNFSGTRKIFTVFCPTWFYLIRYEKLIFLFHCFSLQSIQPSVDDIQQALNKGYQNILEVCRSVEEWSQLKVEQTNGQCWLFFIFQLQLSQNLTMSVYVSENFGKGCKLLKNVQFCSNLQHQFLG